MATLVYAVFAGAASADAATGALTRRTDAHPAFAVQAHSAAPLDGDDMPEAATEIARNTMIAVGVGALVGMTLGLIGGATLDLIGLTPALGAGFGLLTGVLSGLLGGMMAGTRTPKAALREAAAGLEDGAVLLTIEVGDPGHVELVEDLLDEHGAELIDRC